MRWMSTFKRYGTCENTTLLFVWVLSLVVFVNRWSRQTLWNRATGTVVERVEFVMNNRGGGTRTLYNTKFPLRPSKIFATRIKPPRPSRSPLICGDGNDVPGRNFRHHYVSSSKPGCRRDCRSKHHRDGHCGRCGLVSWYIVGQNTTEMLAIAGGVALFLGLLNCVALLAFVYTDDGPDPESSRHYYAEMGDRERTRVIM
jgi:hypothetical protein